jgi:hypothetical protein
VGGEALPFYIEQISKDDVNGFSSTSDICLYYVFVLRTNTYTVYAVCDAQPSCIV